MKKNVLLKKRFYPRITASFPIRVTSDFLGETVDVNEAGLGFALKKPILLSKAKAAIELSPTESVETEFKVIWNKQLVKNGKFVYGACFIRLKEREISILRDALILQQIQDFIDDIQDGEVKKAMQQFFLKDLKKYISELEKVAIEINDTVDVNNNVLTYLTQISHAIVTKADILSEQVKSKMIAKKMKQSFRALVAPWAYKSLVMKRGFEKPRGYPGDYKMLEIIYDNKPFSSGIGRYFDAYFLSNPYAEAVRQRKNKTVEVLSNVINDSSSSSVRILNLPCGSCREIREMLASQKIHYKGSIRFGLIDHDEEAISFSKQALDVFQQDTIQFSYFQENILKFYDNKLHYEKLFGKQDIIYSIGLIDYFPDKMLKKMLQFCLDLLDTGGKLILTIKDNARDPFAPLPPGWFCDWEFVPRNEKDIIDLLHSLQRSLNITTELDNSGKIVFFDIMRNNDK